MSFESFSKSSSRVARVSRSAVFVLMAIVAWSSLGPDRAEAVSATELSIWAAGPVQWLLLPDERKELRRAEERSDDSDLIERFWARRDPEPEVPGNPYKELVSQRFSDADVLYSDEAVPGSLTDRGRALILLGPPTHVSVASRPALAWDANEKGGHRVTTRRVSVEMWGYRREDLPAGFLEIWQESKKASASTLSLTIRFRAEPNRTVLIEGGGLLDVAVRAAVWRPEGN
jgi:GWxTD domain-containing protein